MGADNVIVMAWQPNRMCQAAMPSRESRSNFRVLECVRLLRALGVSDAVTVMRRRPHARRQTFLRRQTLPVRLGP